MRLLLVDDEQYALNSVCRLLEEAALNDVTVMTAHDGVDGFEQALSCPPDLLLTDVRMPRMDGLELARRVAALFPACRIVFLSSYSDKDYLREAIRLHARDYLDKPISREQLISVIRDASTNSDPVPLFPQRTLEETQHILRQLWVQMLSKRDSRFDLLRPLCSQYHLSGLFTSAFRFLLVNGGDGVFAALQKCLSEGMTAFPADSETVGSNMTMICLRADSVSKLSDEAVRALHADLSAACPHIRAAAGFPAESYESGFRAFQTALTTYDQLFFDREQTLALYQDDMPLRLFEPDTAFPAELKQSLTALKDAESLAITDRIFEEMAVCRATPLAVLRRFVCKIADVVLQSSEQLYLEFHLSHSDHELYEQIWSQPCLADLRDLVHSWIRELFPAEYSSDRLVRIIIAYIRHNYSNSALNRDMILDYVGYSRSQISSLFKQTVGFTLSYYITKTRIDEACRLLAETDMSIDAIARAVGFSSVKYFCSLFKSHIAMTPGEYRTKHGIESLEHE